MGWILKMAKQMSYFVETLYNQIEKGVLMSLGARCFTHTEYVLMFDINTNEKLTIAYNEAYDLYDISRYQGNLLELRCVETLEGVGGFQLNEILLGFDK